MTDCTCNEHWLPVMGWENLYEVSSCGRVRNKYTFYVKKPSKSKNGYFYVALTASGPYGRSYCKWIHMLVTDAFLGPLPPGQERCHGPYGKQDNHVTNLYFGTHSQNGLDKNRDGTNYWRNRTHDDHGHILAMPNLVRSIWINKGYRNCLTCNRVEARRNYASKTDKDFDYEAELAKCYANIMKHT